MYDSSMFIVWLLGAVAVVGLIEWGKGMYESIKARNAKSIVLGLALPAVCAGVAFSKSSGTPLWDMAGMWSVAQLGYALIVQSVQKAIKGKIEAVESSAAQTATSDQ